MNQYIQYNGIKFYYDNLDEYEEIIRIIYHIEYLKSFNR